MGRYIGVDLHKNMFVACFLGSRSKSHQLIQYHISAIDRFCEVLRSTDLVGVESTGNTRYFVDKISDRVKEVKVINPLQFRVISHSVKKTDKNDALTIAEFLSKGMLPEIRMKDKKISQLSSLAQTRDKLVKLRTALKNKIHNILNAHGIIISREILSSEKALDNVLRQPVNETAAVELEV